MQREPMFNIAERAPVWLAGIFVLIHVILHYGPTGLANIIAGFGVLQPFGAPGTTTTSQLSSIIGHGFLHGSWGHVLMNSAMTIIFGVVTIRGIKLHKASKGAPAKANLTFLLIFLIGVAGGGLAQWLYWIVTSSPGAALGASGGASALFATTAWAMGGRDKMVQFGFAWVIINVVLVVAEPIIGIPIAWAAHIGGYIAGMLIAAFWVRPNSTGFSITH